MKLDFQKEAYGAGEEVVAHIHFDKLDNTALKNTSFNFKNSTRWRGEEAFSPFAPELASWLSFLTSYIELTFQYFE